MIIPGILASSKTGRLWAPSQDYVSISTATVTSGGASTLTFSTIPSTYKHLQIRMTTLASVTSNVLLQLNGDAGNNYYWHELFGEGTTASAANSGAQVAFIKTGYTNSSSASYPGASIVDIVDYANTNKNKTVRALTGSDSNGSGYVLLRSGLWTSTTAISSITIYLASGSFSQYSQFSLYGVN